VYPHLKSLHPVVAIGALVVSALLATSTITVAPGDTLSEIADRNDVTVAQLLEWNDFDDPDRIFAGSTLIVSAPDVSTTSAPEPDGQHLVTAGETLSAIAARYGTSIGRLVAANALNNPDRIFVGQRLELSGDEPSANPTPEPVAATRSHTVAPGDTLSGIAVQYSVQTAVLARDNGITDPDRIAVGMTLSIGTPAPSPAPAVTSPTPATTPAATTAPAPVTASPSRRAGEILLVPLFEDWSEIYNVPQGLLEAIAWKESNWQPDAVGPNGHLGIAQLSPGTIDLIEGGLLGRDMDPLAAADGIQMAARFLRYLLDRTNNEREATAAWAQGLASVQRGGVTTAGDAYWTAVEEIRLLRS
jgi:LysM repeat protein